MFAFLTRNVYIPFVWKVMGRKMERGREEEEGKVTFPPSQFLEYMLARMDRE